MGPKSKLAALGAFMLSLYALVLIDKLPVEQYLDIAKLLGTALGSHLFTAWVPTMRRATDPTTTAAEAAPVPPQEGQ